MWINKLKINNFRNYNNQEINLEKNINVFYEENAQFFCVVWENPLGLNKIKK